MVRNQWLGSQKVGTKKVTCHDNVSKTSSIMISVTVCTIVALNFYYSEDYYLMISLEMFLLLS